SEAWASSASEAWASSANEGRGRHSDREGERHRVRPRPLGGRQLGAPCPIQREYGPRPRRVRRDSAAFEARRTLFEERLERFDAIARDERPFIKAKLRGEPVF